MITKDQLTKEQQEFFKKHKVSYELLFDAKGQGMSDDLKAQMSEIDAVIAINTEECENNATHTLRTIAGFCPQCDPSKVAAALVEHKVGFVYIAGSLKGKLIKVACTGDTKGRVNDLNTALAKYANYDDWVILYEAKTLKLRTP
jgi:Tfp pilus assembly protein PilN